LSGSSGIETRFQPTASVREVELSIAKLAPIVWSAVT
jgi:hypothetical protein